MTGRSEAAMGRLSSGGSRPHPPAVNGCYPARRMCNYSIWIYLLDKVRALATLGTAN